MRYPIIFFAAIVLIGGLYLVFPSQNMDASGAIEVDIAPAIDESKQLEESASRQVERDQPSADPAAETVPSVDDDPDVLHAALIEELTKAPNNTVYPAAPMEWIESRLEPAEAGDASAQFEITHALTECRAAPSTESSLKSFVEMRYLTDVERAGAIWLYERCLPVHQAFDLVTELEKRQVISALSGYAPAIVRQAVYAYPRPVLPEEVILEAVKSNDPYVFDDIAAMANSTANPAADRLESLAWSVLACRRRDLCDEAFFISSLESEFLDHQIAQLTSRADAISRAIEESDLDAIRFPPK